MRPLQRMLASVSRMGGMRVISLNAVPIVVGSQLARSAQQQMQRSYVQGVDQYRRKTTTLQSMREFFMHPLTWDRNNGYLNVVLALAIFAFIFVNSCTPCPEDRVVERKTED